MPIREELFHAQPGDEPAGKVVQADDPADVPAGFPVIPGTEVPFLEEPSKKGFSCQDEPGIDTAPDGPGQPSGQPENGGQQAPGSVDGKHPQGSGALEGHIPSLQGMEGRKQDFQAPAQDAAFEKVSD